MIGPSDTIVSAATPPGTGGIGIVRISGDDAPRIGQLMLGDLPQARVATLCDFIAPDGEPIDNGIALYFPAQASFTGEPVVELPLLGDQHIVVDCPAMEDQQGRSCRDRCA